MPTDTARSILAEAQAGQRSRVLAWALSIGPGNWESSAPHPSASLLSAILHSPPYDLLVVQCHFGLLNGAIGTHSGLLAGK